MNYSKPIFLLFIFIFLTIQANSQCIVIGSELVTNGDFESCNNHVCGNVTQAFSGPGPSCPDYIWKDCMSNDIISPGDYTITNSPKVCGYDEFVSSENHTPDGQYAALFDGTTLTSSRLWCQDINITPGAIYQFSYYFKNPWDIEKGGGKGVPGLYMTVNDMSLTSVVESQLYTDWDQQLCLWQAPMDMTSATICVRLTSDASKEGNDILLDDISFVEMGGSNCMTYACGTGLPLSLLDFDGTYKNGDVELSWTTANENNVSEFNLGKSLDGENFTHLTTLKSIGNSSTIQHYKYLDRDLKKEGYYRLTIIDFDGHIERSKVIYVVENSKPEIYPNPVGVNKDIYIDNVIDLQSCEMFNGIMQSIPIKYNIVNEQIHVSIIGLVPGNYILRLRLSNQITHTKIIVTDN